MTPLARSGEGQGVRAVSAFILHQPPHQARALSCVAAARPTVDPRPAAFGPAQKHAGHPLPGLAAVKNSGLDPGH
jgi:hypothetical protein